MAAREQQPCNLTDFGFTWGPIEVTRVAEIDGRVVVRISTSAGQEIEVYASRTGRSLRAFKGGKGEMKAVRDV